MSITNIQSDYTPKDFLQKLLGKTYSPEPITQEELKPYVQSSNSQSTIQDTNHTQIFSPKSITNKRIHFQSVQNIQSPDKKSDEKKIYEKKVNIEFKENLKKKPLRKQQSQSFQTNLMTEYNINKSLNETKITQTQQKNKILTKIQPLETPQNLILQKTKLLLRAVLKNSMKQNEIINILNNLQKGLQNVVEFDKIVSTSNIQQEQTDKKISLMQQNQTTKSKSMNTKYMKFQILVKRSKSYKKSVIQKLSRKQKKHAVIQSKQQILKSIKRMKQLVFLNEKSMKRTRR